MKRGFVLAALVVAAVANAGPKSTSKPPPDKFTQAASDAFKAARAADIQNDLGTARGLYTKAFEISPHPATAYNLADVERRADNVFAAIEWYEMYLLLAPEASDVKDVTALIAKLEAMPTILHLESDPPSSSTSLDLGPAFILLDGEIAKQPGVPVAANPRSNAPMLDLDAPNRDMTVDIVTAITFATRRCQRDMHGGKYDCHVAGPPRNDGSLVISSNQPNPLAVWEVGKPNEDLVGKRTKLSPGKHRFMVLDRSIDCQPLTVDVPANNDIAYVFLRAEKTEYRERCRTIEVVQRRLPFK